MILVARTVAYPSEICWLVANGNAQRVTDYRREVIARALAAGSDVILLDGLDHAIAYQRERGNAAYDLFLA